MAIDVTFTSGVIASREKFFLKERSKPFLLVLLRIDFKFIMFAISNKS